MLPKLWDNNTRAYLVFENLIIYALPFVILGLALIMVSRIRYSHVLNQYMKGKKPFAYLLLAMLIVWLIFWFRQPALVICFCGFAASGFVKWLYVLDIVIGIIVTIIFIGAGFGMSSGVGIVFLILSPLFFTVYVFIARLGLELIIVVFRIAENTQKLVEKE